MALIRLAATLLALGFGLSMLMFKLTDEPIWRQRATQIGKWGVVLGLIVIGLFVLRRGAVFL